MLTAEPRISHRRTNNGVSHCRIHSGVSARLKRNLPARRHRWNAVTLKNSQRAGHQDITEDMRSPCNACPARCHTRHAVTLIFSTAWASKMSHKTCGHPEKCPTRGGSKMSHKTCGHPEKFPTRGSARCHTRLAVTLKNSRRVGSARCHRRHAVTEKCPTRGSHINVCL